MGDLQRWFYGLDCRLRRSWTTSIPIAAAKRIAETVAICINSSREKASATSIGTIASNMTASHGSSLGVSVPRPSGLVFESDMKSSTTLAIAAKVNR